MPLATSGEVIVVDASAAVKLVTAEAGAEQALARILRDDDRLAPEWIRIEAANALARKVRNNGLAAETAGEALAAIPAYLTELVDTLALIDAAFALALRIGHAVYDCLYLALAIDRGAVVVTADDLFVRAARRAGLAAHVEMLA